MVHQAAVQLLLYFSIAFDSRLISYLLIVSADLRVILITRPAVFFSTLQTSTIVSVLHFARSGVPPLSVPSSW